MSAFLNDIAEFVTQRRKIALGMILLLTVATGAWLPSLRADPTPSKLTKSSIQDQAEVMELFVSNFGNPDHTVVVLIQAENVLEAGVVDYVHQVASAFETEEYVDHVEAITVTPLAIPHETDDTGESLDDIGDESLDALEEADEQPSVEPELEDALGRLIQSAPEYFPMGMISLADRMAGVEFAPAVEGDTIEEEELAALHRALENAPMLEGRLISRDREVTAVAVFLDDRVEDFQRMEDAMREINTWLEANPPPADIHLEVGGLPQIATAVVAEMEEDNLRIIPLTLLICLVLLYVSFRWLPGAILPMVAVGLSAVMVMGTMAMVGEALTVINNIIPPLLIIIGVSDSIHLLGRYREELQHAESKIEAAKRTVRAMALACLLTSVTTSVGLASLLVSQTEMLRRFGVVAAIGVMLAYIVTIVFLPAAMTYFDPPWSAQKPKTEGDQNLFTMAAQGALEQSIAGLTKFILRHPWWILSASLLFMVACCIGATFVNVDSRLLDTFSEEDEAYTSTRMMERYLDGIRPLEILIQAEEDDFFNAPEHLNALDDAQRWARTQDGVLSSRCVTDFLHESWRQLTDEESANAEAFRSREQIEGLNAIFEQADENPLRTMLSEDGRIARMEIRLADIGSRASIDIITQMRAQLEQGFGNDSVRIRMTGNAYIDSLGVDAVVRDLLGSLTTAVLVIFILLVMLFRSIRLGLLSIPPNIIPLIGTVAWMAFRGIPLNIATVIVFSISLGLAVDGSIHVLARYREEMAAGLSREDALLRAARGTGRAVVVSCFTLMLGFGVMLLSSFVPVQRFGELIAVTVAMCLIATLVVQPALLRVAAPKTLPTGPK